VRIVLKEKDLEHELIVDQPWNRKKIFSENHVQSDIPTLLERDGTFLEGWYAIIEYLEQIYRSKTFLGTSIREKAETRRIMSIFNEMFFAEVTSQIVLEKIFKKYTSNKAPNSLCIRRGTENIKHYFDYISWLIDRRNWLAGNDFSIADISAAAHISCIDYLGSIEWEKYPTVKIWYMRIKSRPSFRNILSDRIHGVSPASHYADLDF
jgi:glutathione S-transferase